MKQAGVGAVKIAAERLLDRARVSEGHAERRDRSSKWLAMQGVDVIATDVQSEEDAVSLIDMGVDLMIGDRLSAPRRLDRRRNAGNC